MRAPHILETLFVTLLEPFKRNPVQIVKAPDPDRPRERPREVAGLQQGSVQSQGSRNF